MIKPSVQVHITDCEGMMRVRVVKLDDHDAAIDALLSLNAELLEALEWMVEKSDAGEFHDGACMKKARAALAKARSQS